MIDIPEEDKFLPTVALEHDHEYVDCYYGAGISKRNKNVMNVWVFCKKCLNTQQIRLDISMNKYKDDEDDE